MRFVCEGLLLSEASLKVNKACATRTTSQMYECIKIKAQNDGIILTATDGEIAIIKKIPADINEEGEVCVQGKMFSDFAKKLEGETCEIVVIDNKMTIRYSDNQTAMQVLPANDYPVIDTDISEQNFVLNADEFKKAISSVGFCVATDDTRPILRGINFLVSDESQTACITALDGFRLASNTINVKSTTGNLEFTCPSRTLDEIIKLIPQSDDVKLFIQKGMMMVSTEDTILTSKLLGGSFIRKASIMPKSFVTTITVDRVALLNSIQRAAILVRNEKMSLLIWDLDDDKLLISSTSQLGNAEEMVKAYIDGPEMRIAMNSKFIEEALSHLNGEKIYIQLNSPIHPFILVDEVGSENVYLILPVRMSNK